MKNLFNLLALLAILAIGVASCNDPCKDVVCENGECDGDGACVCNSLYYLNADTCAPLAKKFEGTYDLSYTCTCDGNTLTVSNVALSYNASSGDGLATLSANVASFDECTTPYMIDLKLTFDENDNVTVATAGPVGSGFADLTGTGTRSGSIITFSFTSVDCQFTLTKQ